MKELVQQLDPHTQGIQRLCELTEETLNLTDAPFGKISKMPPSVKSPKPPLLFQGRFAVQELLELLRPVLRDEGAHIKNKHDIHLS